MKKYLAVGIIYIVFLMALFVGWIMSCVKLTQCDFEPTYKAEVIYTIGAVTAIPVGFFDFGE